MTCEPSTISFCWNEKTAVTLKADGTVEYGEGYTPDKAAKVFWDVIAQHNPYAQEIGELRAALAKYEPSVPKEPDDPIKAYDRAMKVIGRP